MGTGFDSVSQICLAIFQMLLLNVYVYGLTRYKKRTEKNKKLWSLLKNLVTEVLGQTYLKTA